MELHERLKDLRKNHLKMSQAEFAERLGTNRSTINNIERNVLKNPEQKLPLMKLICKEFGVNESWLLEGKGEMFAESDNLSNFFRDIAARDTFKRRLLEGLAQLDEDSWIAVEQFARSLLEEQEAVQPPDDRRGFEAWFFQLPTDKQLEFLQKKTDEWNRQGLDSSISTAS